MITRHLNVALELRVEIDRLTALHERLADTNYKVAKVAKAEYRIAVREAIDKLFAAESKALHRERKGGA